MDEMPMEDGTGIAFLFAALAAYFFFILVFYLFYGYCTGRVFQKAGRPLWTGFVPVYSTYVQIEIVGRPGWWIALCLLPFVNIVVLIILSIDLAKSYGKDTTFGVLLAFFGFIMLPIMAFSSDIKYVGPSVPQPDMPTGMPGGGSMG